MVIEMTPYEITECLGQYPTATIYEAAGKCGDMGPEIRPIVSGARFCAVAYTLRTFPSDTTAVIRALDNAPVGSILVIDSGGTNRAAVWGGTSSLVCSIRGLVGCITNGCVRDTEELEKLGVSVYASGVAPRGTLKNHEGWCEIPISVGGVTVSTGDYIVGDGDGIVVVASGNAERICQLAKEQRCKEEERDKRVRNGESLSSIIGLDGTG